MVLPKTRLGKFQPSEQTNPGCVQNVMQGRRLAG